MQKVRSNPDCCIVFTTDHGYLFPTLVGAIQARRYSSADSADVLIFGFGVNSVASETVTEVCEAENITFLPVERGAIDDATPMMARLFLNRFVPESYNQYLYLDGDVQVCGSLDPLLNAHVRPGEFLAVNDPMTFLIKDYGGEDRKADDYISSLGLNQRQNSRYFNSGVLRINRSGWERIGKDAWDLVCKNAVGFRFADQDPLNIVAADCRTAISLKWNFPIFLRNAGVEAFIRPCVYHFMSSPKPWEGVFPPWNANFTKPYSDLLSTYKNLSQLQRKQSLLFGIRYFFQQRYKQMSEKLLWGHGSRQARIMDYEKQTKC